LDKRICGSNIALCGLVTLRYGCGDRFTWARPRQAQTDAPGLSDCNLKAGRELFRVYRRRGLM